MAITIKEDVLMQVGRHIPAMLFMLFTVFALVCAGSASAKTVGYPAKAPVFTIDFPAEWKVQLDTQEVAILAQSPDEEIEYNVWQVPERSVKQDVTAALNDEVKEVNKIIDHYVTDADFGAWKHETINGMEFLWAEGKGKYKDGGQQVSMEVDFFSPDNKAIYVLIYWGSKEGEEKYHAEIKKIDRSIKKANGVKAFSYPVKAPIFSIEFPTAWSVQYDTQEVGLLAKSPDEEIEYNIWAVPAHSVKADVKTALNDTVKEIGTIIDRYVSEPTFGEWHAETINGMEFLWAEGNGKYKDGGQQVSMEVDFFSPDGKAIYALIYWGTKEGEDKYRAEIKKIDRSIKKANALKTVGYPKTTPIFTMDFPAAWKVQLDTQEVAILAQSPDEEIEYNVWQVPERSVKQDVTAALNDEVKEVSKVIDRYVTDAVFGDWKHETINGMEFLWAEGKGQYKAAEGGQQVNLEVDFFSPDNKAIYVLIYWGTKEGEAKYKAEIAKIDRSIQQAK